MAQYLQTETEPKLVRRIDPEILRLEKTKFNLVLQTMGIKATRGGAD